jgi:hypothetical protein
MSSACGKYTSSTVVQNGGTARTHEEGRLLDRIVADRDDEVGTVDALVNVVARGKRGGAHVEPGAARHRALAHLSVEERDLQAPDEVRQRAGEPRPAGRRTQHHQRKLRSPDELRSPIERRWMSHGQSRWMRRHEAHIRRFLRRDVLRQLEMHGTRALLMCHPKRFPHHGRDRCRTDDAVRHLRERCHRRDDVDDLEPRLLAAEDALLSRDHDHRHRAELRIGGASGEVQRARPQRRETYACLTGQPAVGRRHECGRLLVTRQYQVDAGAAQRLDDIEVLLPRNAEYPLHTFVLEGRHQELCTGH